MFFEFSLGCPCMFLEFYLNFPKCPRCSPIFPNVTRMLPHVSQNFQLFSTPPLFEPPGVAYECFPDVDYRCLYGSMVFVFSDV